VKVILIVGNIILFVGASGSISGWPTPLCLMLMAVGASCFGFVQYAEK